ncbi:hypothetical protein KKE74_01085 [Patescibacteria group bacterium]|nr:hypothetical protein [Patescibacteria group bacterium]
MKNHIKWSASEFEYYNKEKSWFIIAGIFAGILFLWALFTKNILFALLVGLGYFSIIVHGLKKPKNIDLAITPKGVQIEKTVYPFDNLKSFWIFYDPDGSKEISLRSKKTIMPYIKIPLGSQNPAEIRKILIKYLPERKHTESLIDNISKGLRF